jgi:hypothetical protein
MSDSRLGWINSTTPISTSKGTEGVTAKVVKHHFARSEVVTINNGLKDTLKHEICTKLSARPEFGKFSLMQLLQFLSGRALPRLQQSDMMINFNATKWFSKENHTNNYTQMYERGATVGIDEYGNPELLLPKGDLLNPTQRRVEADNLVTFSNNINSPDRSGIARVMGTGKVVKKEGTSHFKIENGQFNPKSRQIFASLNYGRRPHGSNIAYGRSQLILHPNLKNGAIYYMGDTFGNLTYNDRFTFQTLYKAFLCDNDDTLVDLIQATLPVMQLQDTENPDRLLEAHIFQDITFSTDAYLLIVDEGEVVNDTIRENIGKFALKHRLGVMYRL